MDAGRLSRTLARMAHEIVERHPDLDRTALVGVRTRGVPRQSDIIAGILLLVMAARLIARAWSAI